MAIDETRRRSILRFAAPLGIMLLSFLLSSIPGDQPGGGLLGFVPPSLQNLLHLPLFALLAWTWCRALDQHPRTVTGIMLIAAVISIAWAILDEVHQFYVPGRFASLTDITLNLTGTVIGLAVFARVNNRK